MYVLSFRGCGHTHRGFDCAAAMHCKRRTIVALAAVAATNILHLLFVNLLLPARVPPPAVTAVAMLLASEQ
jgi:hypothetical protein